MLVHSRISVSRVDPPLHVIPEQPLRTFPPGFEHSRLPCEYVDTIIGRPFLEWNSRIGVPEDVWLLIYTAVIQCDTCELYRTFEGDRAHRKDGVCNDILASAAGSVARGGSPLAMVLWKGKGRM